MPFNLVRSLGERGKRSERFGMEKRSVRFCPLISTAERFNSKKSKGNGDRNPNLSRSADSLSPNSSPLLRAEKRAKRSESI